MMASSVYTHFILQETFFKGLAFLFNTRFVPWVTSPDYENVSFRIKLKRLQLFTGLELFFTI